MDLVVGSTGHLGFRICELLRARGREVRALVRPTSVSERTAALRAIGATLVEGDLRDPPSLEAACRGAETVYSTATAIVSRTPGDSLAGVDHDGQLALVRAAEGAGVGHFVFVSFPPADDVFPIQTGKRAVEAALRDARMTHTVVQASIFMEVWLSPALGFDPGAGTATVYGTGDQKISYVSLNDVAEFMVRAPQTPAAKNATIVVGGPEALSPHEVIARFEQATGRKFTVQHVPDEALKAQLDGAQDPVQKSFAGLGRFTAKGGAIPMEATARTFGVTLTPLSTYMERVLA